MPSALRPALALLALLAASPAAPGADPAPPRKPNVVLIVSDDHGYGDVGCYGKTDVEAPAIDALARDGVRPVRGVSLLPHLRSGGAEPPPDRYLFWDLYGKMAAVHGKWKLVGEIPNHHGKFVAALPRIREASFELYDLESDVGEKTDLAAKQPEVYRDLRDRYLDWFAEATR